jgi:hypothetical protein
MRGSLMGVDTERVAGMRRGAASGAPAARDARVSPPQPRAGAVGGRALVPWWVLDRGEYRAMLRKTASRTAIAFEQPPVAGQPTVLFIHGRGGMPRQFASLAGALRGRVNVAAFLYDDAARLAAAAGLLREGAGALTDSLVMVAYSIGSLLPAYIGATDVEERFGAVSALYVNPLIGGSRYADADRVLAVVGDLPGLGWLHGVKRALQRVLLPSVVQDLAPESGFQQTIFGPRSRVSSFASRTVIMFTERPGEEPDVREDRVCKLFGRSRRELIARLGTVVPTDAARHTGHTAPLAHPELILPALLAAIDAIETRSGTAAPADASSR